MTLARRRRPTSSTTIDQAMLDPLLLGAALGAPASWTRWLIVLRAAFGLGLSGDEFDRFVELAGPRQPPTRRVQELWCVCGRRSGKTRVAAATCVFLATVEPHRLARGEVGYVLLIAASKAQARVAYDYVLGFLEASPILRQQIQGVTADEVRLRNNITIGVHTGSFRTVRGRTLLAVVGDESSYWRSEDSAQPDVEIFRACAPALAASGGMWIGISTGYRKLGLLFSKWREHFGQPSDDVLVIQAASDLLNPTLDPAMIARATAADPEVAESEWRGGFRNDIAAFLDDQLIEDSINHGRPLELPPQSGVSYKCFVDASAGRGDAYTVAVGHRSQGRLIIDAVRGQHVPLGAHSFDPMAATKQFADLLKQYRVGTVVGDNFSGEWVAGAWRKHGVSYLKSEITKSEIYLEVLPLFTRGLVSLPDHNKLLKELRLLERRVHRSGRDSVDHGRSGHDDYANAVCGVLRSLAFASFDAWDAAWGDGNDQPEPEPFKHAQAEAREYWQGLAAQVHAYSGGRYWPT